MVKLLPSGPSSVPMIRAKDAALQLHRNAAADPEEQNLIVSVRVLTVLVTTSPAVTPAIDDFGV